MLALLPISQFRPMVTPAPITAPAPMREPSPISAPAPITTPGPARHIPAELGGGIDGRLRPRGWHGSG